MSARRLIFTAVAAALAIAAIGSAVASGRSDRSPQASASLANCNGKAYSPTQRDRVLTARGLLTCTGDVAKQRLRTCLEQQRGFRFATVECDSRVRFGPGKVSVVVKHSCRESTTRAFRTRSFLFLRDVSGQTARGKAISDLRVYPRLCT